MRALMTGVAACLLTTCVLAAAGDVSTLVDPYLRIQQALAADSVDGIGQAAKSISGEAAKLGADAKDIQAAADELGQAGDLKAARAAFGRLGDAIMIYIKSAGAGLGDDVKVAYCPMVRKYWLQKGEEIRNPFYGQSMLDCGRLNATIPDLKK